MPETRAQEERRLIVPCWICGKACFYRDWRVHFFSHSWWRRMIFYLLDW